MSEKVLVSRTCRIGTIFEEARNVRIPHAAWIEAKIVAKERGNMLSIMGVVGPSSNGNSWGGFGQILDELDQVVPRTDDCMRHGTEPKLSLPRLKYVWEHYHLNDMHPGCIHQDSWDVGKRLQVLDMVQTRFMRDIETCVRFGRASEQERLDLIDAEAGYHAMNCGSATYPRAKVLESIEKGYLTWWGEPKEKLAGWTYPVKHEEGLLTKACPECGYRYGSSWLFRPLPQDVVELIESLPDEREKYPWR